VVDVVLESLVGEEVLLVEVDETKRLESED
jgi:hypothetical protein